MLTTPMRWHAERSQPSTPMLEATSKARPPAHASAVISALLYVEAGQGASQGLCCSCRQHRACLLARASRGCGCVQRRTMPLHPQRSFLADSAQTLWP